MKKLAIILIISGAFFSFSVKTFGQTQVYPLMGSAERIATGQTKWMMFNLKFDSAQFRDIYIINLKYQLKADSVHKLVNIETVDRKKLYLTIDKNKKDALKQIFSPVIYDRYISLLQSIKQNRH